MVYWAMKKLYINSDHNLTLASVKNKIQEFTLNNGSLPDVIYINELSHLKILLTKEYQHSDHFLGICVKEIC